MKKVFLCILIAVTFVHCSSSGDDNSPGTTPSKTEITAGPENQYGLVADENGNPVQGVVVSDGFSCVATDAQGVYRLNRNSAASYVFFSAPAEYNASIGADGIREFYKPITAVASQKIRSDFKLIKKTKESNFKVIGIGDPQVSNSIEVERFQNETVKDIKTNFKDETLPYYVLVLGDVVADQQNLLQPMKTLLGTITPGIFSVAGNHDQFPSDTNPIRTGKPFSAVFGPLDYSFNLGDVHFICMDDIIFALDGYSSGFSDQQMEWLKEDLSYVSKDKMIVISYHRHTLDTKRAEMTDLLKGYREVHVMAGHTHTNINGFLSTTQLTYTHVHGTACGHWWSSTINADGTPNGYGVYEFENGKMKNWYYKSVGYAKDVQMRLYKGNSSFGGTYGTYGFNLSASQIVANVWNADKNWKVDVYEDGVKTGSMESFTGIDAWATGYHNGVQNEMAPTTTDHLYKYTLKNPNAAIKVVATDRFANQYTETKFTTDLSSAGSY